MRVLLRHLMCVALLVAAALARPNGQAVAPPPPATFRQPVLVVAPGHRVMMHELLRASDVEATIDGWTPDKPPDITRFGTLLIVPDFNFTPRFGSPDPNSAPVNRIRLLTTQARKARVPTLVMSLTSREMRHAASRIAADAADAIVTVEDALAEPYYRDRAAVRGVPLHATAGIPEAGAVVLSLLGAKPLLPPGAVGDRLVIRTSQTPDGTLFDLSALRGRWVALYFWSAHEAYLHERMVESQRRYGQQVQFVGVDMSSAVGAWRKAMKDMSAGWRHIRSDKAGDDIAQRLGIGQASAALLVDTEGRVVVRSPCGPADVEKELEARFNSLIPPSAPRLREMPPGPCRN